MESANSETAIKAKRKVVLITGASKGLGLCLSKQLQESDFHLILTARESSLARFAIENIEENENIWIRPLDITNVSQRKQLISELDSELGGVDILINNAGVSYRSVVEHVNDDYRNAQMDVNFMSVMELTRIVLPKMREKRSGRIVNISSVGGMMAMPTMAVYSASKFALEGATEALYYEVKPWNIKVTLIEPGFINSSSFMDTQYTDLSKSSVENSDDPYYQHYQNMGPFIGRTMRLSPATAEGVAAKIVKIINSKNPPLRVLATPDAVLFGLMRRLLPRRVYHWILYNSLPGVRKWGK